MKALFELFRRFNARRIFGFIRRLGGMSRPKVKCYDLRSTRALRVEGDIKGFRKKVIVYQISIHALRVEGDHTFRARSGYRQRFLSTPSGWRATANYYEYSPEELISIHALRVEGDRKLLRVQPGGAHFYPRPPGGGRLDIEISALGTGTISIHALRVEGDKRARPSA